MRKSELLCQEDSGSLRGCWGFVLAGCLAVWLLGCCRPVTAYCVQHRLRFLGLAGVPFLAAFLWRFVWKRDRDPDTLLKFILAGGFLLRAVYVLAARYDLFYWHDYGSFAGFDSMEISSGHLGYIEYLIKVRHLPDFDPRTVWCFSNPPAFHILEALLLSATMGLFPADGDLVYECLQVPALLFSSATVLALVGILKELGIKKRPCVFLAALLSVHPSFLILAALVNNDGMTACFMALALLYTLRWRKRPGLKRILPIALCLGTAMAAKLNGALLSFGIAVVFLWVFWQNRDEWKSFIGQFTAFLAVCAPLGLFWPVSCKLRFDMPLGYVQSVGTGSSQYIADSTILTRLGLPGWEQLASPFYHLLPSEAHNIWLQTMRTALFDEIYPPNAEKYALFVMLLLLLSMVLCLWMNGTFLWSLWKKGSQPPVVKVFLGVSYGVLLAFYVKFCFDEPYICTMNYRYIPIGILFPCVGAGLWLQQEGGPARLGSLLKKGLLCCLAAFILLAAVMDLDLLSWIELWM